MQHIKDILLTYKAFSSVLVVMTGLLLIRVPLGTFDMPSLLDVIGHFVMVAAGAPLVMQLLINKGFLPEMTAAHRAMVTIMLGITLEVLWEILEFCSDLTFGLSWQPSNTDTMLDISLGVAGATVGALLFAKLYAQKSLDR